MTLPRLAPGRVHLVGHSLGGHLVGVAGREVEWLTGARLARVTGQTTHCLLSFKLH